MGLSSESLGWVEDRQRQMGDSTAARATTTREIMENGGSSTVHRDTP